MTGAGAMGAAAPERAEHGRRYLATSAGATRSPAEAAQHGVFLPPEAVAAVSAAALVSDLRSLQPMTWRAWGAGRETMFRPVRWTWAPPGLPPAVVIACTVLRGEGGRVLLRWCVGDRDGAAEVPLEVVPGPDGPEWAFRCPLTGAKTGRLFIRGEVGPGSRAAHGLSPAPGSGDGT